MWVLVATRPVRAFTKHWRLIEKLEYLWCAVEYFILWWMTQHEASRPEVWLRLSWQNRKRIAGTVRPFTLARFLLINMVTAHGRDSLEGEKRWHRRGKRPRSWKSPRPCSTPSHFLPLLKWKPLKHCGTPHRTRLAPLLVFLWHGGASRNWRPPSLQRRTVDREEDPRHRRKRAPSLRRKPKHCSTPSHSRCFALTNRFPICS